jgi:lysine 6-dehydrogenase
VITGLYTVTGLTPAEFLGRNEECFEFMLEYLRKRNVNYLKKTEKC